MISKGNHVKFVRFVLLAVSEETVFVISRIISQSLGIRLITPTMTLIILDITKT